MHVKEQNKTKKKKDKNKKHVKNNYTKYIDINIQWMWFPNL